MDAIKTKLKILFISRAYPPVTGGIENQNYELSVWLSKAVEVKTIANRHGRKFLPIFAPYALLSALFKMHAYDAVLLGDQGGEEVQRSDVRVAPALSQGLSIGQGLTALDGQLVEPHMDLSC